jgi:hypothetical protein
MRALYQDEAGQRFTVQTDGVVELIEAAVWTSGPEIEANIYVDCTGLRTLIWNIPIPAARVPAYDGHHSDGTPVRIDLDPPLSVRRGEQIDVTFRAPRATFPTWSAVSGIEIRDVDPNSYMIEGTDKGIEASPDLDYAMAIYIH